MVYATRMGLKDFLGLGGAEGKLRKHVARAKNKDAQSVDRFSSLEALRDDGSPEAVLGLLTNDKEESRRIKKRILDGFADVGWDVKGFSGTVEKLVADMLPGARLDNQGKIKRAQK